MPDQHKPNDLDFRARAYHRIPDDEKLQAMTYVQLADILHSCEKDSTKFFVVDRELKKHLAKDQSEINRRNLILGACIGGIFGLVGVIIGAFLRPSQNGNNLPLSNAVQKVGNSNLAIKPVGTVAPYTPSATHPANNPTPVQNKAVRRIKRVDLAAQIFGLSALFDFWARRLCPRGYNPPTAESSKWRITTR